MFSLHKISVFVRVRFKRVLLYLRTRSHVNKGNNKIIELQTILQRESQNS
jgi:hypothetical protein